MGSKKSNVSFLESARVAIETANQHHEIKKALEEVGYTTTELTNGANLLATAIKAFHDNLNENNESSAAHQHFVAEEQKLIARYRDDRAKAKVIFRTNPVAKHELEIDTFQPQSYDRWMLMVENFYTRLANSSEYSEAASRLNITAEHVQVVQQQIATVKESRRIYVSERGESLDATKAKNKAIGALDRWMSDFWVVARIALKSRPQLLESLGKYVPS